jgi:hypothetical protein
VVINSIKKDIMKNSDKVKLILIEKDGKKVFITIEQWREIQLNKIIK